MPDQFPMLSLTPDVPDPVAPSAAPAQSIQQQPATASTTAEPLAVPTAAAAQPQASAQATAPRLDQSQLTPAERAAIEDFLTKLDITNPDHVLLFGADAQKHISDFSESALQAVRTSDTGEVGKMLENLVVELKGFEADAEEPKGIFKIFHSADNRIERMKARYNKATETRLIHFIGKDNIVFHCIVFPAMLKAEGSFILPDNVPSNEFLNLEGDKISTSRNWAVWLHEYLADFPGKQDVLRYVLTANAPETKDNDFTWKDFQARNNNELVAVYGNFVNRALQLTKKYFDGVVPAAGELTDYDRETLKEFSDVKAEVEKLLDVFKFRDAQKEAMNLARIGNKYLADTEPWKIAKTDMDRVATILNISLQLVANLAIAFEPFLPFSSEKLRNMLNMDSFDWATLGSTNLLPAGHQLATPELLFEKIEDSVIEAQVQKLLDTKKANEEASYKANPIRPNIEFDDFMKLDIRVGTVLECQKVPKADKLLQFKIADGLENRTIVSGIAQHYNPEELVGKQVCFIANLAPRKLKGIVSEGMILSAENFDGSLSVVTTMKEVKPGSEVK